METIADLFAMANQRKGPVPDRTGDLRPAFPETPSPQSIPAVTDPGPDKQYAEEGADRPASSASSFAEAAIAIVFYPRSIYPHCGGDALA